MTNKNTYVTGNPVYDSMYEKFNNKEHIKKILLKKYNLLSENLVIFAIPHGPEHSLINWEEHRYILRTSMNIIFSDLSKNVLLSLHPRSELKNYLFLEKEFNARILEETLRDSLPSADFFICHWSGTTNWGPIMSIPTLVLDLYNVPSYGFEYIKKYLVLSNNLNNLKNDINKLKNINMNIERSSLPIFDGNSSKRIHQYLQQKFLPLER